MAFFRPNTKHTALLTSAVCLLIIDRLLKSYALLSETTHNLIGNWFNFALSKNTGIAFSITFGFDLLWLVTPIILALLVWFISALRRRDRFEASMIFIILLGAGSNLFDRLRYGAIIDYFDLAHFSIFNLADFLIVGGALLILTRELLIKRVK